MSVRDLIEKNKPAAWLVAGLILVFAIFFFIKQLRGPTGPGPATFLTADKVFFYDIANKKLINVDKDAIPPIEVDGVEAVEAHVYGCGGCDGDTFIGYLARFTPEGKTEMEKLLAGKEQFFQEMQGQHDPLSGMSKNPEYEFQMKMDTLREKHYMIADPETLEWSPFTPQWVQEFNRSLQSRCTREPARECYP